MSILRIYDPHECNANGVPLDWDCCRNCEGKGGHPAAFDVPMVPCRVCGGHRSLRAAALHERWHAHPTGRGPAGVSALIRCEGCGHQMSEGTWEDSPDRTRVESETELRASYLANAERILREGREPKALDLVHYSPCDEGCRHRTGDALRVTLDDGTAHHETGSWPVELLEREDATMVEASWRQVDVRTLGWPHDLRPSRLSILCLRCYAERTK